MGGVLRYKWEECCQYSPFLKAQGRPKYCNTNWRRIAIQKLEASWDICLRSWGFWHSSDKLKCLTKSGVQWKKLLLTLPLFALPPPKPYNQNTQFFLRWPGDSQQFVGIKLGLPSLQKCVCEIFGEIWFGIRFEIWIFRWEKSGEILGGGLFLPARKARKIFGANFGANLVSNFATFIRELRSAEGRC